MVSDIIFSWAENEQGKMVHVDEVSRGLACNCKCPYCHERLLARHGEMKQHGFAHHSDTRGANLKICYMVIMYKLAEQIIQNAKRIHVPSYYGIFPETDIEFVDVRIDGRFEREDKQPDVVATTGEGQQYLIEFLFEQKVQHKAAIDYKNMNCLEIDLAGQKLETLEDFLLCSGDGRKWINNVTYFSQIEFKYCQAGKPVRVVDEAECKQCELEGLFQCAGVRGSNLRSMNRCLTIEESGRFYRLCKTELFEMNRQELARKKEERRVANQMQTAEPEAKGRASGGQETYVSAALRTCFQCKLNLQWANCGGFANCGAWKRLNVPQKTPPSCAQTCGSFQKK